MSRYDPERIADLAAGALEPAEAAALEAEIAADPRAAAELAAQRLALAAIHRAPAPALSADERAELRRAVAAALHLEPAPVPAALAARRRVPWRSLAVAAAALAAVVAVVPLIGLLSVGERAETTVALQAATTTLAGSLSSAYESATEEADGAATLGADTPPGATTTAGVTTTAVEFSGARSLEETAAAIDELLRYPAPLFDAAAAPHAALPCAAAAAVFLGSQAHPGVMLTAGGVEAMAWFLSPDGATVERLILLDTTHCIPLAERP